MFTVMVATYNGEQYIIQQLDSILNQTLKPDSIHIYDDCSTDNTIDKICSWKEENALTNVFIHRNAMNKGYTRNFVEALVELDDEYIFLCDQDDLWNKSKIYEYKKIIEELKNPSIPQLITSGYSITDEVLNIKQNVHVNKNMLSHINLMAFLKNCSYPGMTFCINRELRNKINEEFVLANSLNMRIAYHDYFISLIAIKYGEMLCINKALVLYRQHEKNQIGVSGKKNKSREYWKKILIQKQCENEIGSFVYPNNIFIESKVRFLEKRKLWFEKKSSCSIFFNARNYCKFYDLKSYLADLYFTFCRK